jgi:hypothetical protein
LPPPDAPDAFVGSEDGLVRLDSATGALPDAIVVVYNTNQTVPPSQRVAGAQADKNGAWTCEIRAIAGDVLRISQEIDNTRSDTLNYQVPTTLKP